MVGGTWLTQNKVRPGVYINFKSKPRPLGTIGDRGIVSIPLSLSWGAEKTVIAVDAESDLRVALGYTILDPQLLLVKEALKRAETLLVYRLNGGTQATATIGDLSVTAKHKGIRGNDISLIIQSNIDDEDKFIISTLVDDEEVDKQMVGLVEELKNNEWVDFSGEGTFTVTAKIPLASGTDGTVTNSDYVDYMSEIEKHDFQTIALPSTDATLKSVFVSFIKRLRNEGKKVQGVIENYPLADHEGIVSVKNGVILADGTEIDAVKATAWVAGATAGAAVNQSLTYTAYDDAVDLTERYSNAQVVEALLKGEFLFSILYDKVIVEQDINTFTSFEPEKGKEYHKNRVIRVLDTIGNDFLKIFSKSYIGKVDNNENGRSFLKAEYISYMNKLQSINAIQNFNAQKDIDVFEGDETDSVYVEGYVQTVDSVEKIYFLIRTR